VGKALEKHRKNGGPLKCKKCVSEAEAKERLAATMKAGDATHSNTNDGKNENETRNCTSCDKILPFSAFNKNQWNKGEGKSRCRQCVEKSILLEEEKSKELKTAKIEEAKAKVEAAEASGNALQKVQARAELAALEAEHVTGLKPVSGKRGRGRGGRGGGRGGRSYSGRGRGKTGK
jgi:hypothetical protein